MPPQDGSHGKLLGEPSRYLDYVGHHLQFDLVIVDRPPGTSNNSTQFIAVAAFELQAQLLSDIAMEQARRSIIQRLAECIEKGYEYVAEVVDIHGGACKVHVRPK